MPRLIAIEGPESGVALPVLGAETFLSVGPDRKLRLARAGGGAVIRKSGGDGYRLERHGAGAAPVLLNGEEVAPGGAPLNHGDLVSYAGATLIFDCDDVTRQDTEAGPGATRPAPERPPAPAPHPRPEVDPGEDSARILSGESVQWRQKAYRDTNAAIKGAERAPGVEGVPRRSPADRLAVLLKVSTAVGATLDLETLLRRLLELVFEEIPADRGTILLFDRQARKLRSYASKRRGARAGADDGAVRVSRTIIKEALSSLESILAIDAMTDDRFRMGESIALAGIRSAMCVPIVRNGKPLGVIHLDTAAHAPPPPGPSSRPLPTAGAFSGEDLEIVTGIASVVALAIENARLYQEAAERERLRTELTLASTIQQRLLPKSSPRTPDLDVFGSMIPAKELGGDVFDFFEDDGARTLHVLVGDVSGKGVGAGLVMAMARSYIRPLAVAFESPKEALVRANRFLYEDTARDMFMSAILLRWDGARKRLVYCGAGQEHMLIVRAGSGTCEAIPAGGLALMMVDRAEDYLEDKELGLEPGDLLVLYSDGVIEARAVSGEFYGLERLQALLPGAARIGGAREVVERITAEVQAFAGEADQHDDITVVALRRR